MPNFLLDDLKEEQQPPHKIRRFYHSLGEFFFVSTSLVASVVLFCLGVWQFIVLLQYSFAYKVLYGLIGLIITASAFLPITANLFIIRWRKATIIYDNTSNTSLLHRLNPSTKSLDTKQLLAFWGIYLFFQLAGPPNANITYLSVSFLGAHINSPEVSFSAFIFILLFSFIAAAGQLFFLIRIKEKLRTVLEKK